MTEERRTKKNTSTSAPGHVFIHQSPDAVHGTNSRLVSSQARRFQSAGKRRQQRISARQDAGYARSLVGWRSTSSTPPFEGEPSRPSSATASLEQEKEEPELEHGRLQTKSEQDAVHISLVAQPGLRVDPFNAFPSSNSKTVMYMVDYHIHVWSPHKAGNFDALMGYNTQLDLCWPLALQDDMLFDATIAVSRVAFVLSLGHSPSEDSLMLYHRGLAMARLRQRVVNTPGSREAVIFTIGRMISIAYMSSEPEAFVAHFLAFRNIAERYIDEFPGTDVARVIENRLNSWKALNWYRTGYDHLRKSTAADLTVSRRSQPRELSSGQQRRSLSPAMFPELDLPPEMSRLLNLLNNLLGQIKDSANPAPRATSGSALAECCRQFGHLLTSQDLAPAHSQLGCGLLVFCLQLYKVVAQSAGEDASGQTDQQPILDALPALSEIAMTFLNKKLGGFFDSTAQQRFCVAWSALVMGSFLAQQEGDNRLRTKGHVIHLTLSLNLGLGLTGSGGCLGVEPDPRNGWNVVESLLRPNVGVLWHEDLADQWRRDWQSSMQRQRQWQQQGLWKIGAPKRLSGDGDGIGGGGRSPKGKARDLAVEEGYDDIDVVEYLVLREARDSLPKID